MSAPRVTGIVLAGGRSTRFGSDKLAAVVDGEPLLHRAIRAVAVVVNEVVVVIGPEAEAPALPVDLPVAISVARDAVAGQGPLAGLVAGLGVAEGSLALLVGGDQPHLRVEVLRALVDALAASAGRVPVDVAALADGGSIWPFPVALRVATVRPAAEAALTARELALFALFERLRVGLVAEERWRRLDPGGRSFRDVDTVDDLARTVDDPPGTADVGPPLPVGDLPETIADVARFAEPSRTGGPWGAWWRWWYRLLRLAGGPLGRLAVRPGFGNLVVLRVVGRRSGVERSLPLGLLSVAGRRYLGHPSGDTAWTLNVRAAGSATIEAARIPRQRIRPVLIGPGWERDAVVRATFRQHPFPGNAMYRLAGRHVAATGVFFRIEPLDAADASDASDGGTA